jgi:hypothetical protein
MLHGTSTDVHLQLSAVENPFHGLIGRMRRYQNGRLETVFRVRHLTFAMEGGGVRNP